MKMVTEGDKVYLEYPSAANLTKRYELRKWTSRRTDVYGNNRACNCEELMQVMGMFCVCIGKAWCPTHGGPRCVGGHD